VIAAEQLGQRGVCINATTLTISNAITTVIEYSDRGSDP
jgi:hypothetical protein